jgi:hypothetical protein
MAGNKAIFLLIIHGDFSISKKNKQKKPQIFNWFPKVYAMFS